MIFKRLSSMFCLPVVMLILSWLVQLLYTYQQNKVELTILGILWQQRSCLNGIFLLFFNNSKIFMTFSQNKPPHWIDRLTCIFPNFQIQFFSKHTQFGHMGRTKVFLIIKPRDVKIWADLVYLGQPVSSECSAASSLPHPACNRLCTMLSQWVIAMQPTAAGREPAGAFKSA